MSERGEALRAEIREVRQEREQVQAWAELAELAIIFFGLAAASGVLWWFWRRRSNRP